MQVAKWGNSLAVRLPASVVDGSVRPDPDRFSLAPCSLGQGRCAPAPPVPPAARRHP